MKNLGTFEDRAVALFREHFVETTDFSESTEDFVDFATCQRPDGSVYGTSGQCRKGSPTSAKSPAEKKPKVTKSAKSTKVPTTQQEAQAARRAAVVNALKKEKLPTNPVALKNAAARELRKDSDYTKLKEEAKVLAAEAKAAKKNAQEVAVRLQKGDAKPSDLRTADAEMNRTFTRSEKARVAMVRMEQRAERQIAERMRQVSVRAINEARKKEPIVGNDMGGQRRLGDGDISTSPRD